MTLCAQSITTGHVRGRPVFSELSAVFEAGRVTAIVGPNGAGKSTLLRALAGQMKLWSGRIELGSRPIEKMPAGALAASIALTPQRPQVSAPFSVRTVISLGRYAIGADDSAIERAMDWMELTAHAEDNVHELSVGQQQRVTLARALAQLDRRSGGSQARVLLADEPTAALDPKYEVRTMGVLRRLAAEGVIVVVVMHGVDQAAREADDAIVLREDGSLEACGPAKETLTPERLTSVFGTKFIQIESADGRALVPSPAKTG